MRNMFKSSVWDPNSIKLLNGYLYIYGDGEWVPIDKDVVSTKCEKNSNILLCYKQISMAEGAIHYTFNVYVLDTECVNGLYEIFMVRNIGFINKKTYNRYLQDAISLREEIKRNEQD